MGGRIEVPVGGIIKVSGTEVVCVEDYKDKYGVYIGCGACPIQGIRSCEWLNCTRFMRTDFKSVHFEYYYRESK